jgi:acetyltransferase-like isoleucine patch superfamily enzyme
VICAGLEITLGEHTIVGSGAMLLDNDFHQRRADGTWATDYTRRARPIRVGRSVFIGARAIILKGVEIGDNAVIGAGAVVTCNVPPSTVFAGNPARQIDTTHPLSASAPEDGSHFRG